MWNKGNPRALLVGMQAAAPTMEHRMELPQKIKDGTAIGPSDPTFRNSPKQPEKPIINYVCTPIFREAQFTIA